MWLLILLTLVGWVQSAVPGIRDLAESARTHHVALIGDFGTGESAEYELAAAVEDAHRRLGFEALLTVGDNIYPDGRPANFEAAWTTPYGWVEEAGIPVVASLGNHDVQAGHAQAVMNLLGMPDRWYTTTLADGLQIFALDGNQPNNTEQKRWLEESLARPFDGWRVAIIHQPPYSCSNHDGIATVRDHLLPLLETGGVQVMFAGHDHNWQRFAEHNGVVHVVAGAGGRVLYDLDACPESYPKRLAGVDKHTSFATIAFNARTLRIRGVDADGRSFDEVTLRR